MHAAQKAFTDIRETADRRAADTAQFLLSFGRALSPFFVVVDVVFASGDWPICVPPRWPPPLVFSPLGSLSVMIVLLNCDEDPTRLNTIGSHASGTIDIAGHQGLASLRR
jgi:hypothetical protein